MPDAVHWDQGRNFESAILKQSLNAFGISKSHTTAYHPKGDGMVERFNCSLLQLLRTYIETESDWEKHLPLALYAYCTAVHASTGVSPHILMFGRPPHSPVFQSPCSFNPTSYQFHLCDNLAKLQDFVESNLVTSSANQKPQVSTTIIPCKWQCLAVYAYCWKIRPQVGRQVKNNFTEESNYNGKQHKVVHVYRQHPVQPMEATLNSSPISQPWCPPEIEHFI